MTAFDDLARRAARAAEQEASAMLRADDALDQVRAEADALVLDLAAARPTTTPQRRTSWRALGAAAAAMVIVAGVGVVLSGGEGDETVTDGADATTATTAPARSTVAPVPVEGGPAWNDIAPSVAPYYLGGGLTLTRLPEFFTTSAEEIGELERTTSGQLLRRSGEVSAETYVTTLRHRDGRTVVVGMKRGEEPPQLLRTPDEEVVVRRGEVTVAVATDGFDDRRVAEMIADGLTVDPTRLLDRFDVDGAFDSVLQRGGYGSAGSWVLEQGESSGTRRCLRLVVAGSGYPGGWNFCLRRLATSDDLAYIRIGDRSFVVGLQSVPEVRVQPVRLVDGSELAVLYDGWTGPVIRELPTGVRVATLDGQFADCPIGDLADAIGLDAVVVQVVECAPGRAILRSVTGSVHAADGAIVVERGDDGDWMDPFPQPSVYLGGGLWADDLPDAFRRSGGLLGGPFTMDVGGAGSHAVRIDEIGFGDTASISIGYTRDGAEPSWQIPTDRNTAGRRSANVTLWASSPDLTTGELQDVVDALRLDRSLADDDGEAGEFGSLIAGGPANRGWTEWRVYQASSTFDGQQCYVLAEDVFGRPPPPALEFCVGFDAMPSATTVVVRSANTYVFAFGPAGEEASGPTVFLADGEQIPTEWVRSADEGGDVFVAVVPAGSTIEDVSWTEELGRGCTFRGMWDQMDLPSQVDAIAVEVRGCELFPIAMN